jgi:hypothetical protein
MSVILNLRGTNCSGKSTVVRRYMELIGVANELEDDGKIWAYELKNGVYVLGRYQTVCGGCDTIHSFAEIRAGVTQLAKYGHVLFEGVLWSTVYFASVELARSLPQHRFIFGMLDTPLDVCLKRVLARRAAAGNTKLFNPEKQMNKHATIRRCHEKLLKAGLDARILHWENPNIQEWIP